MAEEITRDKLLQHRLLQNTGLAEYLVPTTMVGGGWVHGNELKRVLGSGRSFIVKPLLGVQGVGVRKLSLREARAYSERGGPLVPDADPPQYFEDFVDRGDFTPLYGMRVLQPFIDTRRRVDNARVHRSVRAIVCNGEFVDAYARVSEHPVANLSRGAVAMHFRDRRLPGLCERAVQALEERCAGLDAATFRRDLYTEYVDGRGRTTAEEREYHRALSRIQILMPLIEVLVSGSMRR